MSFFNEFDTTRSRGQETSSILLPEHIRLAETFHVASLYFANPQENQDHPLLTTDAMLFDNWYEKQEFPAFLDEVPFALQKSVEFQQYQRKVWRDHDLAYEHKISQLLFAEHQELMEELAKAELGVEVTPFGIASEIGDIYYLTLKYMQQNHVFAAQNLPQESQQILQETREVCAYTAIAPHHALHMKLLRNEMKYLAQYLNNGIGYNDAVMLCRGQWSLQGGDIAFSEWYLDNGDRMLQQLDRLVAAEDRHRLQEA